MTTVPTARRLGLEPGKIFDRIQVSPMARSALEAAPAIAMESMKVEFVQSASIIKPPAIRRVAT